MAKRLDVSVIDSVHKRLKARAKKEGMSLKAYCAMLLAQTLKNQ